jgi:energy-coupling factor transport system substrate-specific component
MLAVIAVMTAIVLVLTYIIRVPTPAKGYAHLGDTGVFFGAFAFGPIVGGVAGGLGTALSDLLAGYLQYAPATLIIHGLEGLAAGWIAWRVRGLIGLILASVVGGIIVVGGYFLFEVVIMGMGAALGEVVPNILQVAIGALVAIPLYTAVRLAYPPITQLRERWR